MKRLLGTIAVLTLLCFGGAVYAADPFAQAQSEKKSEQKKAPGEGPMGEMEKGGGGPSGPQTTPPGKAPGFKEEGKKKGGTTQKPGGGQSGGQ
jgi:hypothetical protein